MKKVILFGLGKDYREYQRCLEEKYTVLACTDNTVTGMATDYDFIAVDQINNYDYDSIIICSRKYYIDIFRQLRNMGISEDKLEGIGEAVIEEQEIANWEKAGCPVPSPDVYKRKTVRDYAGKYGCNVLIETGTYHGGMIEAQIKNFGRIASVELFKDLYDKAVKKFEGFDTVRLYHGDSSKLLGQMIDDNVDGNGPVFWLDGHYSGDGTALGDKETPIIEEIEQIAAKCRQGVLLVDDARCFRGEAEEQKDYPSLEELEQTVRKCIPGIKSWEVKDDIIRCVF